MLLPTTISKRLNTPENKAFLKRVAATAGPDHPYVNGLAIGGYTGPMIWAEAVKKAGSFEKDALMAAVAQGIEWSSPSGRMVLDGKTHSTQQDVHIIQVKDRKWSLIETKKQVPPLRLRWTLQSSSQSEEHGDFGASRMIRRR